MNIKKLWIISIIIAVVFVSTTQVVGIRNIDDTTLEINDIRGGIGGVIAYIKNTGSMTAENFFITISVKGGFFDNIDILQECGGCGNCGTTIATGEIKAESTLESSMVIGFGQIDIVVTAEADNADLVSVEANGFVLGPFVIII